MVVGPYRSYPNGPDVTNLYLLRYDRHGTLLSPETFEQLKNEIVTRGVTDVFLFCHGWNNTFDAATERYENFISGFIAQRVQFDLPEPDPYRPLLVGVIWPSTSFVMPWEEGPVIAAARAEESGAAEEMTRLLTDGMPDEHAARFAELVDGGEPLGVDHAKEAATLLLAAMAEAGDHDGKVTKPTADDLLAAWLQLGDAAPGPPVDPDDFGAAQDVAAGDPSVAALRLDPRVLLRMGTVWKMHDRAGTVGAHGASGLVQFVLNLRDTAPRLHLVGHSFGAKVVLSALSVGDAPAHKAHSVLLLQPAINRWCFAPVVIGTDTPGGYHVALDRVDRPIFATFSRCDHPLHDVFHLVVGHVGELQIAAVRGTDRYGALGGYGPNGLGELGHTLPAIEAGSGDYDPPGGARVVAIDGSVELAGGAAIKGHGDISNPVTWWALHELTGSE